MTKQQKERQIIINKIVQHCKPEKIIIFGSSARGDDTKISDIDLLIIKQSSLKRPFRVKEVFEAVRGIDRQQPIDPIVYTPEEINARSQIGDPFIREILEQGKVVYESK